MGILTIAIDFICKTTCQLGNLILEAFFFLIGSGGNWALCWAQTDVSDKLCAGHACHTSLGRGSKKIWANFPGKMRLLFTCAVVGTQGVPRQTHA